MPGTRREGLATDAAVLTLQCSTALVFAVWLTGAGAAGRQKGKDRY